MTEIKTKRKPRKPKSAPEATSDLVPALRWIMRAQNDSAPWASHCRIGDGWAVAYNGAVAAGHAVSVDWFALPHTARLLAAMERAQTDVSMVVDDMTLTVHSGRLTVRVPCLDVLPEIPLPGPKAMGIDGEALLLALRAVLPLTRENALTVLEGSIELANSCATATNRRMVIQAWHGVELPRMVLPRAAAAILLRQDAPTGAMWDEHTVTFFWPNKWLRFNLYEASAFPDCNRIFAADKALPALEGLSDAIEALTPHASDGRLFIEHDESFEGLRTATDAATYRLPLNATIPIDASICFQADMLKIVAAVATKIDFNANGKIQFYGDKLRGALVHMVT